MASLFVVSELGLQAWVTMAGEEGPYLAVFE